MTSRLTTLDLAWPSTFAAMQAYPPADSRVMLCSTSEWSESTTPPVTLWCSSSPWISKRHRVLERFLDEPTLGSLNARGNGRLQLSCSRNVIPRDYSNRYAMLSDTRDGPVQSKSIKTRRAHLHSKDTVNRFARSCVDSEMRYFVQRQFDLIPKSDQRRVRNITGGSSRPARILTRRKRLCRLSDNK